MIGLQDINLKQTRVYQDALLEGRQEGKQESELTIILCLLKRRFGSMHEKLVSRLHRLNASQLEAFSELLLNTRSIDDLDNWLQGKE